ncbi:hypothetical protein LCGC14_1185490 [marine sediment metagenome]|uniref:Bbp19-like phage domain-containing protein n=1 Tax=marine sediment metagenome TaxID=412755 RepID=A0A0F9P3R5_9ZZZZ
MTERDKQVADEKAKNEKRQLELTQAFKRIFLTDDGKILKNFLEKGCNVNVSSVCISNPNALQTHFAEGKRKVYLDLMWYLNEGYKEKENE